MAWLKESWLFILGHPYFEIAFRLVLATILGGLVGLEREQSNRPAGFRTHILVCVGSALIMLISIYGFEEYIREKSQQGYMVADPARLAAQVVSGIGFLGAGTILVHGFAVRGLTTAASLWVVAGIGLALGAGFYFGAVFTTCLVLLSLIVFNRLDSVVLRKKSTFRLEIKIADQPGKLGELTALFEQHNLTISGITVTKQESHSKQEPHREAKSVTIIFRLSMPTSKQAAQLLEQLHAVDGVLEIKVD